MHAMEMVHVKILLNVLLLHVVKYKPFKYTCIMHILSLKYEIDPMWE